jgi:hypothetical protein
LTSGVGSSKVGWPERAAPSVYEALILAPGTPVPALWGPGRQAWLFLVA